MSISSERIAALRNYIPEVRELTIDGKPVKPAGETWDVYNPATEEVIATVGGATKEQVDEAIRRPVSPLAPGRRCRAKSGAPPWHSLADRLEARWEELLASIINEVGTPISTAEFLQVKMGLSHLALVR